MFDFLIIERWELFKCSSKARWFRHKSHCLHTLIVYTKQPAFFSVTPETYQHLIGRAVWWFIGLSVRKDSEFPGCFLWSVPKAKERSKFRAIETRERRWCVQGPWDRLWAASACILSWINTKFKSAWHNSERTKQSCVSDYCQASSYCTSL